MTQFNIYAFELMSHFQFCTKGNTWLYQTLGKNVCTTQLDCRKNISLLIPQICWVYPNPPTLLMVKHLRLPFLINYAAANPLPGSQDLSCRAPQSVPPLRKPWRTKAAHNPSLLQARHASIILCALFMFPASATSCFGHVERFVHILCAFVCFHTPT